MRKRLFQMCLDLVVQCKQRSLQLALVTLLAMPALSGWGGIRIHKVIPSDLGEPYVKEYITLSQNTVVYDGITYEFHLGEVFIKDELVGGLPSHMEIHSGYFEPINFDCETKEVHLVSKFVPKPNNKDTGYWLELTPRGYAFPDSNNDMTITAGWKWDGPDNENGYGDLPLQFWDDIEATDMTTGEHAHTVFPVLYSQAKGAGQEFTGFRDCPNLETVYIPSDWTEIPDNFFAGSGVKNVIFESPSSCKKISRQAFFGCENLESINLPSSLEEIADDAFYGCRKLTSVTLAEGLKTIGSSAFNGTSLKEVTLPSTLTSIGEAAFSTFEKTLKKVNSKITNPFVIKNVFSDMFIEDAIRYYRYPEGFLQIPEGTKSKYQSTDGWKEFFRIYEGEKCGQVFTDNVGGREMTFTILDDAAEKTCMVGRLSVESNNYSSNEWRAMANPGSNFDLTVPSEATLNGVKYKVVEIGHNALFFDIFTYRSVSIPDDVTFINEFGIGAIGGAESLKLPKNLKRLASYAITQNWNGTITSLELPSSLEVIGLACFQGFFGLKSINIPAKVNRIEHEAFSLMENTDEIDEITVDAGNSYYDSRNNCNAIIETATNTLIVGCKKSTIPEGVEWLGLGAFSTEHITEIHAPKSLKGIADIYKYSGDFFPASLTRITVDAGNTTLDSRNDCNAMIETATNKLILGCKNTVIPNDVKIIAESAFPKLQGAQLTIPAGVEKIEGGAFRLYNSTLIVERAEPLSLDDETFYGIEDNNNVLIVPVGAKEAYASAPEWKRFSTILEGDNGKMFTAKTMENVEVKYTILDADAKTVTVGIPNNNSFVGTEAIDEETEADKLTIPSEVTYNNVTYKVVQIGAHAFQGCWGVKAIELPNSIEAIGTEAFYSCSISDFKVNMAEPVAIDEETISNKDILRVPVGSKEKYEAAAVWKDFEHILEGDEQLENGTTQIVEVVTEDGETIETEISVEVSDDESKKVTITAASAPETASEEELGVVAIPAEVTIGGETYHVTEIADDAFAGKTEVTDIYLPETEEPITIGENALKIDDNNIATIHTPLSLLDDYALNVQLKQNFEAGKVTATVTAPNKYWTFSSGVDVVVPEGVSVYTCLLNEEGTEVEIMEIDEDQLLVDGKRVIKANNGVLVASTDGSDGNAYEIVAHPGGQTSGSTPATTDAKSYGDNLLEPVIVSKNYAADDYYVMYENEFHAIEDNSSKVPACKAVLKKPVGVSATRTLGIGGDGTTGISRIETEDSDTEWYNLNGQRINRPTTKGLFIKNGQKVIIK